MIKPLCFFLISFLSDRSLEHRLHFTDFLFERALDDSASPRDFELAVKEYPQFEKDFEKLLHSRRVKRMRDLLRWVDADRIARNWLEERLQEARLRLEKL
jgi:hypothetical protein